jgi:hypothetical protein
VGVGTNTCRVGYFPDPTTGWECEKIDARDDDGHLRLGFEHAEFQCGPESCVDGQEAHANGVEDTVNIPLYQVVRLEQVGKNRSGDFSMTLSAADFSVK